MGRINIGYNLEGVDQSYHRNTKLNYNTNKEDYNFEYVSQKFFQSDLHPCADPTIVVFLKLIDDYKNCWYSNNCAV